MDVRREFGPRQAARPVRHYVAQRIRHRADAGGDHGGRSDPLLPRVHRASSDGPYLVHLAHRRRPVRVDRQVLDPQSGAFHGQRRAGRLLAVRRAGPDRIADGRADAPALDLAPAERPRTDQSPARRRIAAPRRRLVARDARRGGRLDGRSGTDHLARCGRTGNPEGSRTTEKRAVRRRKDQDRHGAVRAGAPEGNGREARPLPESKGPHRQGNLSRPVEARFRKAE